jgi:sulfur relay (sulfurtransferase) DsrF/TusC family protein
MHILYHTKQVYIIKMDLKKVGLEDVDYTNRASIDINTGLLRT